MDANPLQTVKSIAKPALRNSFFNTVAVVVAAAMEDQASDMVCLLLEKSHLTTILTPAIARMRRVIRERVRKWMAHSNRQR